MIRTLFFVAIVAWVVGGSSVLSAHTEGASFEQAVGAYTIDVGYEPEKPTTAERVVFDFDLRDTDDARVDFDTVWVRLEQDQRLVLATGVNRNAVGGATLVWVPPMAGEAHMTVRYMRAGNVLSESTFVLPVTEGAESSVVPGVARDGLLLLHTLLMSCLLNT
jgi:hypothetical protein